MNLPTTIPTHRDVAWYLEECRVLKAALDGLQHPYIESRRRMVALETELDKLRAQIGTPPEGTHADEQIPRAGTWHQERLNWISEIETARAYIVKCEAEIKERAAVLRDVMRERDKAEAELAAERAKVKMLGIALQSLVDEQNDAPLERRRGHWQMAMDDAGLALATAAAALP